MEMDSYNIVFQVSQLILPVCSLMLSSFLYADSLASIMNISVVRKCCYHICQHLNKVCVNNVTIPYMMKVYMEFNLATWLKFVEFTE